MLIFPEEEDCEENPEVEWDSNSWTCSARATLFLLCPRLLPGVDPGEEVCDMFNLKKKINY